MHVAPIAKLKTIHPTTWYLTSIQNYDAFAQPDAIA